MSQLGFTFYPKDWWTSDSFFALNPFERYIYLELLFMMYDNSGYVQNDKVKVERRLMATIKDDVWLKIADLMAKEGDQLTHKSVNKRLRKAITARENGKNGGAPVGNNNAKKGETEEKQPKQPSETTEETTQNNPPYKEKEKRKEKETNTIDFSSLLSFINQTTGRSFKSINDSVRKKFNARLKDGYSKTDILSAIKNAVNNEYHKGNNFQYLTPEFFSRADTLDKYSNVTPESGKISKPVIHGPWDS